MIIDYIQLENFLSHNETNLRLENGVNIIYGKNGAGKSSIVDAIRFALFGEKRGDKIVELIRNGSNECSVTIGFRLNDAYFEVFRSLGMAKSGNITRRDSWIKRDGVMVAETAEGVTREIQNGLRIPREIFLNSVFVRQGEMDALISETQANREKMFSKIIGIDILSESAQKVRGIRSDLRLEEMRYSDIEERSETKQTEQTAAREEANAAEVELGRKQETEKLTEKKAEESDKARTVALQRKSEYDSIRSRVNDIEQKLTVVRSEIESGQGQISELSFSYEEKKRLESDPLLVKKVPISRYFREMTVKKSIEDSLANVRNTIEGYEKDSEKAKSLEPKHHKYIELKAERENLTRNIQELSGDRALSLSTKRDLETDRQKLKTLEAELSSGDFEGIEDLDRSGISDERNSLEDFLRSAEGKRRALKERLGSLNDRIAELRKNRETLGGKHKCPVCGSDLDQSHLNEIHEKYRKDEVALIEESGRTASAISSLGKEYKEYEAKLEKIRGPIVERFLEKMEETKRVKQEITRKEAKLEALSEKLEMLSRKEEDNERVRAQLEELESVEREYNSLSYAIGRVQIEKYREELRTREKEYGELSEKIKNILAEIGFEPEERMQVTIEELEVKLEEIRKAENQYNILLNKIEVGRRSEKELETELEARKGELESYQNVAEVLDSANEKYISSQRELTLLRGEIATLRERMSAAAQREEKLRNELKELEADRAKLSKIKAAAMKLEKLREAFDRNGIQALIRKDSSVAINNMARNYLASFNFEFDDLRIDENFDIRVINNGVEEPLDALSGGERISLAIAVRLAIARYLTGRVSTVIMDEPTNFLDEDRRSNLKDIIQYSLKDENMVQQMIMITHHAELTSAADSTFEVTKKNGISIVSPG